MSEYEPLSLEIGQNASTLYAIPASQRSLVEETGVVVYKEETIGRINVLGEEIQLPVVLVYDDMLSKFISGDKECPIGLTECRIENTCYPFIPLQNGCAEFGILFTGQVKPSKWHVPVLAELMVELTTFSECVGGLRLQLHAPPPAHFHEAFNDQEGLLHIFIHTVPMTDFNQHHPHEVFGMNVETAVGYYSFFKSVRGRGVVLSDGKHDIVQIIGNNIYVFFDPFELMEAGKETGFTIFRKTIALALNHLLKKTDDTEGAEGEQGLSGIQAAVDALAASQSKTMNEDIVAQLETIREKEAELLRLRQNLAHTKELRNLVMRDDFYGRTLRDHLTADYGRIATHQSVASIVVIPEYGFEVITKTIYITHNGHRRRIGAYALRFRLSGNIHIWTKETHHKDSVPHPHVSAWNGPCFGNVKSTIDDAIAEYRYADAVEYILEWLTNGYSPELVIHNHVEEWPLDEPKLEET